MEQILEPRADFARAGPASSAVQSAVSWPAIFAGSFVAVAISLLLLALGSGLGFAAVSPWPSRGISGTTFAVTAAIWLIIMQWISSAFGGYVTGRLRTRWIGTHTHEVFFRDTAHGFVTWAVATVVVAVTLASTVFSAIGGGAHALSAGVSGAAQGASQGLSMTQGMMSQGMHPGAMGPGAAMGQESTQGGPLMANAYGIDKLFRSTGATGAAGTGAGPMGAGAGMGASAGNQGAGDARMEASHIVANAWSTGSISDADRSYLSQVVAARTGLSPPDADKRVDEFVSDTMDAVTKAKAAADTARKAAAQAAIYTALAMLVGAFIASVSATLGGRLRDEHI